MTNPRPGDQGGQIPQHQYPDAEAQLGGADAVEKTTYVTGEGTNPHAQHVPGTPAGRMPAQRGRNPIFWIVAVVVVLLIIAYAAGLFR
jgi:hypothetical protein